MEFKLKLWSLLVILSIAKVSHGQLMCYVCENCPDASKDNLLLVTCDEDYFNSGGTNEPSTQTTMDPPIVTEEISSTESTTDISSTESSTSETTDCTSNTGVSGDCTSTGSTETTNDSTTMIMNSTTETSTTEKEDDSSTTTESPTTTDSTTTTETTTDTTTTSEPVETTTDTTTTTQAKPPTPPTVQPSSSTSAVPTPPNPGVLQPIDDLANDEAKDRSTPKNYITSSEFRVRQLRSVPEYTYSCYKVLANVNGSMITSRGCTRVKTMQSVCGLWKEEHPTEQLNKCYPCTSSRCNGSTALTVSISALILAIVATLLQRK